MRLKTLRANVTRLTEAVCKHANIARSRAAIKGTLGRPQVHVTCSTRQSALQARVWSSGGASGIGKAVCKRLAAERASVLVTDLRLGPAESVAAEIRQLGGEARAVQVLLPVLICCVWPTLVAGCVKLC